MDSTWKELCAAYDRRDWAQVEVLATCILDWLAQGGCPPQIESPLQESYVRGLIVKSACRRFLRNARRETGGAGGGQEPTKPLTR